MKRRSFAGLLAGATVGSIFDADAQQPSLPVIGFIASYSQRVQASNAAAIRQGLKETGYVEGQNVSIEYRVAEGHYDRLAGLAAELVERKVAVILADGGSDPVKAAKAATSTIPIVFFSAADPVRAGIVASLNRPGGNVTGVSMLGTALEPKRLEVLNRLSPGAAPIGALVNPKYSDADFQIRALEEAARSIKRQILIERASTEPEIDTALATLTQRGVGALSVAQDPLFNSYLNQIVALAARYKLPAIYTSRNWPDAGGLISYGPNFTEGHRQAGVYVGKVLNGARPADLPVLQPTKFELVINLKTAKAIGLAVPNDLIAVADEVIE